MGVATTGYGTSFNLNLPNGSDRPGKVILIFIAAVTDPYVGIENVPAALNSSSGYFRDSFAGTSDLFDSNGYSFTIDIVYWRVTGEEGWPSTGATAALTLTKQTSLRAWAVLLDDVPDIGATSHPFEPLSGVSSTSDDIGFLDPTQGFTDEEWPDESPARFYSFALSESSISGEHTGYAEEHSGAVGPGGPGYDMVLSTRYAEPTPKPEDPDPQRSLGSGFHGQILLAIRGGAVGGDHFWVDGSNGHISAAEGGVATFVSSKTVNTTAHPVSIPVGSVGQALLVYVLESYPTSGFPIRNQLESYGFTYNNQQSPGSLQYQVLSYFKILDGNESFFGSDVLSLTTPDAQTVMALAGLADSLTGDHDGNNALSLDPASLDPSWGESNDTLWLTICVDNGAISGDPDGYSNIWADDDGIAHVRASVKGGTGATEDPSAYSSAGTDPLTVVVAFNGGTLAAAGPIPDGTDNYISLSSPSQLSFSTITWRFTLSHDWDGRVLEGVAWPPEDTMDLEGGYQKGTYPWYSKPVSSAEESFEFHAGVDDVWWQIIMLGHRRALFTDGTFKQQIFFDAGVEYTMTLTFGEGVYTMVLAQGGALVASQSGSGIPTLSQSFAGASGYAGFGALDVSVADIVFDGVSLSGEIYEDGYGEPTEGWNTEIVPVVNGRFSIRATPVNGSVDVYSTTGELLEHPSEWVEIDDVGSNFRLIGLTNSYVQVVYFVARPTLGVRAIQARPTEQEIEHPLGNTTPYA